MKNILFLLILFLNITLLQATIIESNHMDDIRQYLDQKTLVLFDMDDTLTDSPYFLGSGLWRQYVRQKIPEHEQAFGPIIPGKNLHDLFSFYIAKKWPVQPENRLNRPFFCDVK